VVSGCKLFSFGTLLFGNNGFTVSKVSVSKSNWSIANAIGGLWFCFNGSGSATETMRVWTNPSPWGFLRFLWCKVFLLLSSHSDLFRRRHQNIFRRRRTPTVVCKPYEMYLYSYGRTEVFSLFYCYGVANGRVWRDIPYKMLNFKMPCFGRGYSLIKHLLTRYFCDQLEYHGMISMCLLSLYKI